MMQNPRAGHRMIKFAREKGATAAETALGRLRERILSGEMAAGTKLNQSDLALELGMSRIPVRDAIRALADEGLVTHDPHRTAVVASLSMEDVVELYEMRIAVEPLACSLAVPHLTEEDLGGVRRALDNLDRTEDPARWLETHDRFHGGLYRRSGRPRMISLLDRARAQTRRYTWIRLDRDADEIAAEHRLILAAAERGDPRSLRMLVEAHLTAGYETVTRRLAALMANDRSAVPAGFAGLNALRGGGVRPATK